MLYDYILRAEKLFDETHVAGTTILAVVKKNDELAMAQICKAVRDGGGDFEDARTAMKTRTEKQQINGYVPAKGEEKLRRWPFDTFVWWDALHSNRIVSQLLNEGYGDDRLAESTGEYAGGLLQFPNEGDRFVIHTVVEGVRTTTLAFRESTEEEDGDRVAGYIKLPVTEADRAIIQMVMDSAAYRVPLVLGQPPKNFTMSKAATA